MSVHPAHTLHLTAPSTHHERQHEAMPPRRKGPFKRLNARETKRHPTPPAMRDNAVLLEGTGTRTRRLESWPSPNFGVPRDLFKGKRQARRNLPYIPLSHALGNFRAPVRFSDASFGLGSLTILASNGSPNSNIVHSVQYVHFFTYVRKTGKFKPMSLRFAQISHDERSWGAVVYSDIETRLLMWLNPPNIT